MSNYLVGVELIIRSCRVVFVFVSELNGLKYTRTEPDLFIKRVEDCKPVPD